MLISSKAKKSEITQTIHGGLLSLYYQSTIKIMHNRKELLIRTKDFVKESARLRNYQYHFGLSIFLNLTHKLENSECFSLDNPNALGLVCCPSDSTHHLQEEMFEINK